MFIARMLSTLYGICLALCLLVQHHQTSSNHRKLELAAGLIGLVGVIGLIGGFVRYHAVLILLDALFLAVPSSMVLIRGRNSKIIALALALMALTQLYKPLIYSVPPFVSVSVLLAVGAIYCIFRDRLQLVNLRIVCQIAAVAVAFALCTSGLIQAYQVGSTSGVLLYAFGLLLFSGLAVLRIWLGDYWWSKRPAHPQE